MTKVTKLQIPVSVMACPGPVSEEALHLPEIKVIGGIGRKQNFGSQADDVDLLVLTQMAETHIGPGFQVFDEHFGGALSRAVAAAKVHGHVDEHILVEVPNGPRVAIFGLGKAEEMGRRRVCALFNYVLALSIELNLRSVMIPVFPHRLTADELNLKGTAATFNCMLRSWARKPGGLKSLEEVRFLCTHQAKVQLDQGFLVTRQLCATCKPPVLP